MKGFMLPALLVTTLLSQLPSSASAATTLCAFGDWGMGNRAQKQVGDAAAAHGCTDIILLGDNFYPSGVRSTEDRAWRTKFREPFQALLAMGTRFWVALGNHDYLGSPQAQIDYSDIEPQWRLPSSYHGFAIGDACFVGADTNDLNEEQAGWIAQTLASPQCRWRVVFGHHPVVSSGEHGATGGAVDSVLRPLLANAHLYLAGHDHQFSDEGNIAVDPLAWNSPTVRQLVVGTGGAKIREGECQSGGDCRAFINSHGFLALEWDDSRLSWTFYDQDGAPLYSAGI